MNLPLSPGVYTVNGTTYILTLKAEDFGEGANKHSVGSASIITAGLNAGKADDGSAISSFTAGTDVTLTAVPDAGYAVDYWTYDGKEIEDSKEKNSVTIKTLGKTGICFGLLQDYQYQTECFRSE